MYCRLHVVYSLWRLTALAAVLASIALAEATSPEIYFEAAYALPRIGQRVGEASLKPTEVFPIALVVSNLAEVGRLRSNFSIDWRIWPVNQSTPADLDKGTFSLPDKPSSEPVTLVSRTNAAEWVKKTDNGEVWLEWKVTWQDPERLCGSEQLSFTHVEQISVTNDGISPDEKAALGCPTGNARAKILLFSAKANSCPSGFVTDVYKAGDNKDTPDKACIKQVDDAEAKDIVARASSLASASPTATGPAPSETKDNAAGRLIGPAGWAVLVAACVMGVVV